jgi:hypothetical protein
MQQHHMYSIADELLAGWLLAGCAQTRTSEVLPGWLVAISLMKSSARAYSSQLYVLLFCK